MHSCNCYARQLRRYALNGVSSIRLYILMWVWFCNCFAVSPLSYCLHVAQAENYCQSLDQATATIDYICTETCLHMAQARISLAHKVLWLLKNVVCTHTVHFLPTVRESTFNAKLRPECGAASVISTNNCHWQMQNVLRQIPER